MRVIYITQLAHNTKSKSLNIVRGSKLQSPPYPAKLQGAMPPGLVRQWQPEFQAGFRYYRYLKLIKFLIFFGVMVDKIGHKIKKRKKIVSFVIL